MEARVIQLLCVECNEYFDYTRKKGGRPTTCSPECRKTYWDRYNKNYNREYRRDKYANNEKFREKVKESSRKWCKKEYDTNPEYRQKKIDERAERYRRDGF